MTTSITVSVPVSADYKAVVENVDRNDDNETQTSLAGVVVPGDTAQFYVHKTRDVVIREVALENNLAIGQP